MSDPSTFAYRRAIAQMRQRQAAFAWWFKMREKYPLGLVSIPTASRMIGVSRTRLHNMVKDGRFRLVGGLPGGTRLDKFIPVEDLMVAPFKANRGRPGVFGPKERRKSSIKTISGETTGSVLQSLPDKLLTQSRSV